MGASAVPTVNNGREGTDAQSEQGSEAGYTPAEDRIRMTFHRTEPSLRGRSALTLCVSA
jgi:hypothetical protein